MVTRSGLPQNFYIKAGTIVESFGASAESWTKTGTGTHDVSTAITPFGSGSSLHIIAPSNTITLTKALEVPFCMETEKFFEIWVYCVSATADANLRIYLSTVVNASKSLRGSMNGASMLPGWNQVKFTLSTLTPLNGELTSSTMTYIRVQLVTTNTTAEIYIDEARHGGKQLSNLIMTFDNNNPTIITAGLPLFEKYGGKGTIYAVSEQIDYSEGTYTSDQLDVWYAAGGDIGNHTLRHDQLGDYTTVQANIDGIQPCTEALIGFGWPRAAYHIAYPSGNFGDLTRVACAQLGMLTGRALTNRALVAPIRDIYDLPSYFVRGTVSVASILTSMATAAGNEQSMIINAHGVIEDVNDYDMTVTQLEQILQQAVGCNMRICTITEFYEGMTNPRYKSLPLTRA